MLKTMTAHASWLPVVSMILFMALFCTVAWYVFSDRRQRHQQRMCHLPLDD